MTPRRILALGWLVFLLYAYPGYMTSSSLDMMLDARFGEYSDWHSPLMAFMWRVVGIVAHGPAGMLLVQSGCLLIGTYVLLRRMQLPERTAAIASAALLVFPPVMSSIAVIDPNAMLASLLVAGTAMFTSERRPWKIGGLVMMVFACGMREGAWLAAAPLVSVGFVWSPLHRRVVRYGIATGAFLAAALLSYGFTNALIDHPTRRDDASLAMLDIAGILGRTSPLTDEQIHALAPKARFSTGDVQAKARTIRQTKAAVANLFDKPLTDAHVEGLVDARATLRKHDLGAYAATRWRQWQRVLSPRKKSGMVYTDDGTTGDLRITMAHDARHSAVQKALIWLVRLLERTPLFLPFVYLALALVMLPFARRDRPTLVLIASGVLLELSLAITTYDFDYRYSTWLVVATTLAAIVTVYRQVQASRSASPSPPPPV